MILTLSQHAEAREEGWATLGGYGVRTIYKSDGEPYWGNIRQIVEFIEQRGAISEWHAEFYLSMPWSDDDNARTSREGWRMNKDGVLISFDFFLDKSQRLTVDNVISLAQQGSLFHQKGLKTAAKRKLTYQAKPPPLWPR